ncbi:MAG: helix-turn-helix transcriptional regulator [Christensenellaceae bacterium]|jgi:transcriptional regulator with XRE-family HTH domain|nr:helix-turn-helix transcriptional regulator [Christensenellaceae bacterium]
MITKNLDRLLFAKRMRAILKEQNLTQAELSQILNIRQSQVSNLASGKSLPSYITLYKIHNEFGVEYSEFFE